MAQRAPVPGDDDPDLAALVDRARSGDGDAWTELYGRLAPAVAGYLRLRGARDAADLTSETFLGVFRNIGGFSGTGPEFRSWVFVIAHRRLQDERRRAARRPVDPVGGGTGHLDGDRMAARPGERAGHVEDDAFAALEAAEIRDLCDRLAPDQADVLLLRILGDLTVDQVAAVVGKSAGAVKQLQRRGLAALRHMTSSGPYPSGMLRR
jgi:RNA polymerase sigma-70 factor (ECF subfamily)